MEGANKFSQQFLSKVDYQYQVALNDQLELLPLFKLSIKPYDYYIKYSFQGEIAKLQFYQELQSLSNLIISPEHSQVEQIEKGWINRLFNLTSENKFSISCFLKYYNYTIKSWINYQKECKSVISQQEILMVFKKLLRFHKSFYQQYRQNCQIFKAEYIYITPEKSLKIYPQTIQFSGQIAVHRQNQSYLNCSQAKLSKQLSIQTTHSNSQVHLQTAHFQTTHQTQSSELNLNQDIRDIFILVMQLLSFRKYDHFYNQKHSMIVWDAVNTLLDSTAMSHLSKQFINLLKECAQTKFFEADWLLIQIEKILSSKQKVCKTIRIEKNFQLVEIVQKKAEDEKSRKMQDISFIFKKKLGSLNFKIN